MKLYTGTGDDGSTGLFGGERVAKSDGRIEAYGTVDELNSAVGWARAASPPAELDDILAAVQADLFVLGGDLATRGDGKAREQIVPTVSADMVRRVADWIDATCQPLAAMRHFILPGGCELSARLHVARTVCRRAERAIVRLADREPVNPHAVPYVNRLGDWLFAAARRANQLAGVADVPWRKETGDRSQESGVRRQESGDKNRKEDGGA